jgi:hypothetical protein
MEEIAHFTKFLVGDRVALLQTSKVSVLYNKSKFRNLWWHIKLILQNISAIPMISSSYLFHYKREVNGCHLFSNLPDMYARLGNKWQPFNSLL